MLDSAQDANAKETQISQQDLCKQDPKRYPQQRVFIKGDDAQDRENQGYSSHRLGNHQGFPKARKTPDKGVDTPQVVHAHGKDNHIGNQNRELLLVSVRNCEIKTQNIGQTQSHSDHPTVDEKLCGPAIEQSVGD